MKRNQKVIPLTVRMAKREDLCQEVFTVRLTKSEKLAYDHHLKVHHIRTLLYLKATGRQATSIETVANDLQMPKEQVIGSLSRLRKDGFIQTHAQALAQ